MKSRLLSIVVGTGVVVLSLVATSNVYGFGYGYGAVATGGTTAFKVTNLNDSGTTDCWYVSGNYKDLDKNGSLNGTAIAASEFTAKSVTVLSTKQHNPSTAVPVHTAAAAVSQAASGASGCQPLDSYDTTLVSYLKSYGTQGKKGK